MRKLFYPPFHKNLLSFNIHDYVSFCGGGKARDWSIGLFAVRANNKIMILSRPVAAKVRTIPILRTPGYVRVISRDHLGLVTGIWAEESRSP